jgi:Rad3-related DNA helicase
MDKNSLKTALASESIFHLQGPPGTGKTQVIAEINGSTCKAGKKVLISSETHKAIDNVFERLPKIRKSSFAVDPFAERKRQN